MSRVETRTALQIEANALDLAIFRVAGSVEQFSKAVPKKDEATIIRMAKVFESWRIDVRAHMHPKDRESTS